MSDTPITDAEEKRSDAAGQYELDDTTFGERNAWKCARQLEKKLSMLNKMLLEAKTIISAVDNGPQPDINKVNWHDKRKEFLAKLREIEK